VINFSGISNSSLLGRALRVPLRLIAGGAVVGVAQPALCRSPRMADRSRSCVGGLTGIGRDSASPAGIAREQRAARKVAAAACL